MANAPNTIPDLAGCEDADLVRLACSGVPDAFGAIITRYNQRLYRVARAVLRDGSEAEDALQEAYLRAFAALNTFRNDAALGTWLTRIVVNEALGRLKRRRKTEDLDALDHAGKLGAGVIIFPGAAIPMNPEQTAALGEIRRLLERAIDSLPESFRLVFVLRDIEGMSVEETAEHTGLQPATVKTRLHRARAHLRKALDGTLSLALQDTFPFGGARCERTRTTVMARIAAGETAAHLSGA
jgi:RNA polymerase sigma-70 factor, ECF subfamily